MSTEEVILLDYWISPFAMRAKIALAEKGVEFKAQEENFPESKSDLLLKSNPVYKKVPVLLHNGKAVNESSIIVNYIDDTWPTPALFPPCAFGKAQARFWADYIDKKVFEECRKIWTGKGDEVEAAKKVLIETLKTLEGALGEKTYFGGDTFGFVDVILIPFTSFFLACEKYGGFKVEEEAPKITAWMKKCLEKESVSKFYNEPTKVAEFISARRKRQGLE
ncbi:glutathione transferase [Ranunculus cassubicifolius]